MKRKIVAWIVALVLIVSLLPVSAFATSSAAIETSKSIVEVGDTFTITLKIPAIEKKSYSAVFAVKFDKESFKVTEFTAPTLSGAGASMQSTVAEANGTGVISCSYDGADYENSIDLAAGTTVQATFEVLDTVVAGKAYAFAVDGNKTYVNELGDDGFTENALLADLTGLQVMVTIKSAHTHVFDQKVTTEKYLASAASCTAKATYYYSCTCGEKGTATFESGETLPHTPSTEWKSNETHHWHVCTTCKVEMDKDAHTPDHAGHATEDYAIKCTVCGYVIEAQLDHEHSFTQEVAETKYLKTVASCTSPAVYYKSCTCGEASPTETFTVGNALGHSYTAEKVAPQYEVTPAGCETDAVYFKSCARCGAKGTETFTAADTALGHVQASPWAQNETEHWQVCTRCHKEFHKAVHNGGTATCQEQATCGVCGTKYGKLGEHNFDTKWSSDDTYHFHKCLTAGCTKKTAEAAHSGGKATCQEKAKCDVCKAEYGELGAHNLTKTDAKKATCLEPGNNEYYTCSVCGKVFKDAAGTTDTTVAAETLAKLTTHNVEPGKYATSATHHWQICKDCGTVIGMAAHKFGEADANGRKTCADCGYTVGGTGTEGHKHAAGATMGYDENNHWNKCTDANCDAHVNESAHKFGKKNPVTEGNTTITVETCSECGYVKRTVTTNTTPVNPGGNKPTKPSTKDDGKKVESGKTFDAGIGLYVGLSILSMTGSAVVIGKKRKTR